MNETQFYTPEMNEAKPQAQLEIRSSLRGGWIVKSPTALPKMRGLKLECVYTPEMLTPEAQAKVGWHEYYATRRAMEALRQSFTSSCELLLD